MLITKMSFQLQKEQSMKLGLHTNSVKQKIHFRGRRTGLLIIIYTVFQKPTKQPKCSYDPN